MNRDRNGNLVDAFGVPLGPMTHPPAAARHANGEFKDRDSVELILTDTLVRSGVELGEWDLRMVAHFADVFDWDSAGTVLSWVVRAHKGDTFDTTEENNR